MWCRLLVRAVLQRTQHFGLQIPTCAWLRHAAMSRPPAFCFNQVKSRRGTQSILGTGWSVNFSACLRMSTILLLVGSVGWCWPVLSELRSLILVSPAAASIHPHVSYCQRFNRCRGKADSEIGKLNPFDSSIYAPSAARHVTRRSGTRLGRESAARIVARERSGTQTRFARHSRAAAVKHTAKEPKPSLKPSVRLASLESAAPPVEANPSHIPSNVGALTSLVDFETAPFPYHGSVPNSGQPFLNAGAEGHWGHINFRGDVLWESQTFSDDRVLLHIPPGFDPKRPAVMVVFFHGPAPISRRT
jgi:hypothetical protein